MRALAGVLIVLHLWPLRVAAEDGYQLWLRYPPLDRVSLTAAEGFARSIVGPQQPSLLVRTALGELERGLSALLGREVTTRPSGAGRLRDGTILVGTPESLPEIGRLNLPVDDLGDEGFLIRSTRVDGVLATVIAARRDAGLLHGVFGLLRLLQNGSDPDALDIAEAPVIGLRILNHWDNLDRSVERGYAGESIWDWWRLPDYLDPRYVDYARANASIGVNGTVLNNVNAQAEILSPTYIVKAAALADRFRPYGIRTYFSVRFSSPADIGGLDTADPMDPQVRAWWAAKADEIYAAIPDFGGFLVKANAEGQPGPHDYGRSHAEGANVLADALRPHGGVVMWRAFVYSQDDPEDRVKQAYHEFTPLDGEFAGNVLVQAKNGPLDFQPREPFHPLFGAMPETPLMLELQITQEYLGFSTHLVYLGTLFEEVFDADTFAGGQGSTVARVVDGSLHGHRHSGVAGVANIGTSRDWTGSSFGQANWYAFGRLAWNPALSSRDIAEEWLRMTFSHDPEFIAAAVDLMMRSREAAVNYMTPLGLAHLMGTGHHYGPAPWVDNLDRPEWNPAYYHRATSEGIGFDRTSKGSNAVAQYAGPVARRFANLREIPAKYLLWFHRLPWDYRMPGGSTLWEEIVAHYDAGVAEVDAMQAKWASLERFVDPQRFDKTRRLLAIQAREARWWRDACVAYFQHVSGRSLPAGAKPPQESLEYYRSLEFPYAPGN
jgi:alpha-glucuronidase